MRNKNSMDRREFPGKAALAALTVPALLATGSKISHAQGGSSARAA